MPPHRRFSRRALLASGITGTVIGGGLAASLRATGLPRVPTLSVIGSKSAQIALLDTTQVRTLMLLGVPGSDLVSQVPAMMTALRQRIDLVVGEDDAMPMLGDGFTSRWMVRQYLVVPPVFAGQQQPDSTYSTRITQDMAIVLGPDISLAIRVTPRKEWMGNRPDASPPLWSVTIEHARNVVLVAPTTSAAMATSSARPSLVVTPDPNLDLLLARLTPGAIAMNGGRLDDAPIRSGGTAAVRLRTFPEDIARIELREDGIRLPPWADAAHSSD